MWFGDSKEHVTPRQLLHVVDWLTDTAAVTQLPRASEGSLVIALLKASSAFTSDSNGASLPLRSAAALVL
jgi:hypothetical protein